MREQLQKHNLDESTMVAILYSYRHAVSTLGEHSHWPQQLPLVSLAGRDSAESLVQHKPPSLLLG